jgi:hypothetical protein
MFNKNINIENSQIVLVGWFIIEKRVVVSINSNIDLSFSEFGIILISFILLE